MTDADPGPDWDLLIHDAVRLDDAAPVSIGVRGGQIEAVAPSLGGTAASRIDARGGLVTPSFVDPHFHIDKVLSRDLLGALGPQEALDRAREAKVHFTVADVEERACRALQLAAAHGIGRLHAQIDVDFATKLVSFEGVMRARDRFAGVVDVTLVAFPQEGIVADPEAPALLREALSMGAAAVGGLPEVEASVADQRTHVETVLDLAAEFGVSVEMHCDYMDRAELQTMEMLADATVAHGMQGKVVASHCNALAVYPDDEAARVIDKVLAADMAVAVLPTANLQMLGGEGRTPHDRGSSRVKEMLDAGINVAAGADNMYDIWFRFNRMDPAELAYITVLSAGLRTDDEVREGFEMVTTRAAKIIGAPAPAIAVGAPADLVIFEATSLVDILRRLPGRRIHIKAGRPVGGVEGSFWSAV